MQRFQVVSYNYFRVTVQLVGKYVTSVSLTMMLKSILVKDYSDVCIVRTAEETEEYQRVSKNVGKGLAVIQEELHRMRIATKAQVESLEIQKEVSNHLLNKSR